MTDLEVAQHLGRRRLKVKLHEEFQVVVDGIETCRNHQESIMIRLLTERRHQSIERRFSVLIALQVTSTSDVSHHYARPSYDTHQRTDGEKDFEHLRYQVNTDRIVREFPIGIFGHVHEDWLHA